MVRTLPFQGGDRSSILLGATNLNFMLLWDQYPLFSFVKKIIGFAFATLFLLPLTVLSFSDSQNNLNEKAITYLQEKGVVQGYSDGTYRPYNSINRAEFLKITLGAIHTKLTNTGNCFPDISTEWYASYVCTAKSLGIVSGYSDGYFRAANSINLAEALKITLNAYKISVSQTSPVWYEPYISYMQENSLLSSINGDVTHMITRGEMAQIIYNLDNQNSGVGNNILLTQYPMTTESNPGEKRNISLSIGETYDISNNDFLRLEEITNNGAVARFSLWNKDSHGCRMADPAIFLKDLSNYERYSYYGNWFVELQAINENSVSLNLYSGDLAYKACTASSTQAARCLAFHPIGTYKIQSEHFARYFSSAKSYDFNNLMLNYTEAGYKKLASVFPSLASSAHPYGSTWNFIAQEVKASELKADSAWQDTAIAQTAIDDNSGVSSQLLNNAALRDTYAQKIMNGDLNFNFSTEIHEFTHMSLFPTELSRVPNPTGDTSKLAEGIADYVQSVAHYYPDQTDPRKAYCGTNHFLGGRGSVLDNMTYIEAFKEGYNYDAGDCFFKEVENVCGLSSIDTMFKELLSYQYSPFSSHPNLFKILENSCKSPANFDQTMKNFGFSSALLNETYQPGEFISSKTSACHL